MRELGKRILLGVAAFLLAGCIWVPCLHFFFTKPPASFHQGTGLSPRAKELAERHLQLWTTPSLREGELNRMRASNAEWDFMGRSFLVWSLANMGLRDPTEKARYLETMDRIIEETLRLEQENGMYFFLMGYAKAKYYVAQPPRSLFIDGEIALMLAARRLLEEKAEYKPLLASRLEIIEKGLQKDGGLILESYPNECWTFDHCVALVAMRVADHIDGSDHSSLIRDWIAMAKQKLVDSQSGLLVSSFTTQRRALDGPEGSTLWMVCHCLQALDEEFAHEQYRLARRQLGEITLGFGYAHEWPPACRGHADIDSGPIIPVFNISAGSSGMALIGASAFGDDGYLSSLAATLDFAAFPSRQKGALKYSASNQVGDAALLYAATLGPMWERIQTKNKP